MQTVQTGRGVNPVAKPDSNDSQLPLTLIQASFEVTLSQLTMATGA